MNDWVEDEFLDHQKRLKEQKMESLRKIEVLKEQKKTDLEQI